MYQIMCHCVSQDCSNCPMKNTGTVGSLAEWNFFYGNKNDADNNTDKKENEK